MDAAAKTISSILGRSTGREAGDGEAGVGAGAPEGGGALEGAGVPEGAG